MTKKQKVQEIIKRLSQEWPEPQVELNWSNPWELLVATILAAQATDKVVNTVTPDLFKVFPKISDYADSSPEKIEQQIMKINFHKNKANYIFKSAQMIMDKFNGQVPSTMEELTQLPGVARKTANVVLSESFGKKEGIIVDTHVKRLSRQLGLTKHTDPAKIEKDLMEIVPQSDWLKFAHLLTLFGRYKCPARKNCSECPILGDLC